MLGGLKARRDSEVDYAIEAIKKTPENESPWRYLRGLYKDEVDTWVNDPRIASVCLSILKEQRDFLFSLSTVLDLLCHGLKPSKELTDSIDALRASDSEMPNSTMEMARSICSILGSHDPMRASYWAWRKNKLLQG